MKWWLFAGAVFLTLLAFGRHFDAFNDFMFHYLPMYNKFRTVEMALVIPGLVLPIIAIWGLNEIFSGKVSESRVKAGFIGSLAFTGGICLIIWLLPTLLLDFKSPLDASYEMPDWYYIALLKDRASLASADAFRSLVFILLSAALIFAYYKVKDKKKIAIYLSAGVAVLMLIDFWPIDKRYLNESHYTNQSSRATYRASAADNKIFEDKDLSYRVINLNNPFQETNTSYFHKSLGGYHAAKFRRYQELIEHRMIGELNTVVGSFQNAQTYEDIMSVFQKCPTLNMLNTRYVIFDPNQNPIINPYADGNAWFVNDIKIVDNADAEIDALNTIDPKTTAVVDKRFAEYVSNFSPQVDSTATIIMDSYRPNKLAYTSKTASEQLAIFSEIYYQPGWNATIDGQPAEHFRADWILRAMRIPAGEHKIVFEFRPQGYITASYVSTFSSFIILLLLIAAIGYSGFKAYKQYKEEEPVSDKKKK